MDDYIVKPVKSADLLAALAKHTPLLAGYQEAHTAPPPETPAGDKGRSDMVTDLPGIDFDAGLRYANGRIANYRRILRLFNDTHGKEFAGRMHSAMERDNWEEASRQAHSFKSAARTIGADHLGRLGKELEDACLARQAEYAEKILGRLEIELRIVCAGLEALPGD